MSVSPSANPVFPKEVAKAIVQKIQKYVVKDVRNSRILNCEWNEKDNIFGLPGKTNLQFGELLGSGGFCDVYAIRSLKKTQSVSRKWAPIPRKTHKEDALDRSGKPKYAIKQLRLSSMRSPKRFCGAATDLVLEAHFLRSLDHENIISIRGWSPGGVKSYLDGRHDSYFIILDRLHDTLDKRIEKLKQVEKLRMLNAECHNNVDDWQMTNRLISRTVIVRQVASALQYLHSKHIIFRDLKASNVGFDASGNAKLFDFGLCRELPEECVNVNDEYKMSGKVGTLRYMAPEVILFCNYNQKVDTYSWAMLYWQCLTLTKPYEGMDENTHLTNVCRLAKRPPMKKEWPESIRYLLKKSWEHDPHNRLTMLEARALVERAETELRGKLKLLSKKVKLSRSPVTRMPFVQHRSSTLVQ